MVIELRSDEWRVTLSPHYGATILSADARRDDGRWEPIFAPLEKPEAVLNGGCFVMAPFANRIKGGRFNFNGRDISFPMNRPTSNVACHGLARERVWDVLEQDATSATLHCRINEADYPWRFSITQRISISGSILSIELEIENEGDEEMPFGLGLHPWFPRTADTLLKLPVPGHYEQDDTGLPTPVLVHRAEPYLDASRPLTDLAHFDACFAGWPSGTAQIIWPSRNLSLILTASGALARFVHLYSPDNRDVFCVEPVSHPPDVVNRPALGNDAAMTVLSSGEKMSGELQLRASTLQNDPGRSAL